MNIKRHPAHVNYGVTRDGRVYSFKNKMFLKPLLSGNKGQQYFTVSLKAKRKRISRLVAEVYIPNPFGKKEVNHKDGNRLNNHVSNLEWVTPSENMYHSYRVLGRKAPTTWAGFTGELSIFSKPVTQMTLKGEKIKEFVSITEANKHTGIHRYGISQCAKGIKESISGYKWKFKL